MIVVASLNTAWDVIVQVRSWQPGTVARADRQLVMPGGKALNVARNCAVMGVPLRLVALADAELAASVRRTLSVPAELEIIVTTARSRTDLCLTTGDGTTTVVNGPAPDVEPAAVDAALDELERHLDPDALLVVAGRQLPGAVPRLLAIAERRRARIVVDLSGPELRDALGARPAIAKVNSAELGAIGPASDEVSAWQDGRSLAPEPTDLVVTRGDDGLRAWLADGAVVEVHPPIVRAVNAFGAGDALLAGILATVAEGGRLIDGLRRGSAWAAASVERFEPDFDPTRAGELEDLVEVTTIREASTSGGSPAVVAARGTNARA